jgi:hypothetical protein
MNSSNSNTASPTSERPWMPDGYGLPISADGLLTWPQVEAKLVVALNYWLATVRPDGRPHVVPRWGVWLSGQFYYDGAPTTRHARNVATNPRCALHLESGTETVIVEGISAPASADPDGLGADLSHAFVKYQDLGYAPGPESWSDPEGGGLRVLTPERAIAWFTFPTDATRFRWANSVSSAGGAI